MNSRFYVPAEAICDAALGGGVHNPNQESCIVEACVADQIATRKERQERQKRQVEPPRAHAPG